MKIAFVGKGGSGKSSTSWLMTKTIEDMGISVLAIDADHNMDLTSNLGVDPEKTPLMHKTDKDFLEAVGLTENDRLLNLALQENTASLFTLEPLDAYTEKIVTKISPRLSLINIGLGSPDLLFQTKCAHALSGPLKFYLGLLDEGKGHVVIDSVAGADMLNYGLYAGIDAVIGVIEPHRNSVKVFEQIYDICKKTMIPCYAVINKPTNNEFYAHVQEKYKDSILGEIPLDTGILSYDFAQVTETTKENTRAIIKKIESLKKRGNLSSIKNFQEIKGNI
jgi:CO dehydrogenase maturation factor